MDAAQSSNSVPVSYGVLLKATENWNGTPSCRSVRSINTRRRWAVHQQGDSYSSPTRNGEWL